MAGLSAHTFIFVAKNKDIKKTYLKKPKPVWIIFVEFSDFIKLTPGFDIFDVEFFDELSHFLIHLLSSFIIGVPPR